MNLSKELKKKRDAEDRLRNRSPQVIFTETSSGKQSFKNADDFALKNHNHDLDYAHIEHNHDDLYVKKGEIIQARYFEPITNGDSTSPEIIFFDGDIVMGEVI